MSNVILEKDEKVFDRMLKQRKLIARVKITANAVPASKAHFCDLENAVLIRSEGKIAEADAIEAGVAFTAANDVNGIFGLMFDKDAIGEVSHVLSAEVRDLLGSATVAFTFHTSAEGNIAMSLDTNINLATTNADLLVAVEYIKR